MKDWPSLPNIRQVDFYKRDELTTDLICCEAHWEKGIVASHEESEDWPALMAHLAGLDAFDARWPEKVVHSPFAESRYTAYHS